MDPNHAAIENQLTRRRTEIGQLVSALDGVAREIHSASGPMTAAVLNADMLSVFTRRLTDPQVQELAAGLRQTLTQLRGTFDGIRRLLSRARFDGAEPVDIRATLNEALAECRNTFAVRCTANVHDDVPATCHLRGGHDAFHAITRHLLTNAAEGDSRGQASNIEVELSFEPAAYRLVLQVVDDGPGLPPDMLEHTAPFKTTKQSHSGLGLFECELAAWLSGGTLSLGNRQGSGATVRLSLGVQDEPAT